MPRYNSMYAAKEIWLMERMSISVRRPIRDRVEIEAAREDRTLSETGAMLIEEALDAREKKAKKP